MSNLWHLVARGTVIAVVSVTALVAFKAASPGAAAADAGSHASCVGIESSSISPPGSSDELPGGRAELAHFVKGLGGPPGATYSFIAKLQEGSHEACDEATE